MQTIKIKCPVCDMLNVSESLHINQIGIKEIRLISDFHCYKCGTDYRISTSGETAWDIAKEQIIDKEGEKEC